MHSSPQLDDEGILRCLAEIQGNRRVRLIMERARAIGVPYSWAVAMWADQDDIHMEMAYDEYLGQEAMERCQGCNTKPDEVWGDSRPLPEGWWMIAPHECAVCDNLDRANDNKEGVRYKVVPRPHGVQLQPNLQPIPDRD